MRLILEQPCGHGKYGKHVTEYDPAGDTWCDRPQDIIIDPSDPHRIEAAADVIHAYVHDLNQGRQPPGLDVARDVIQAFLKA